MKRLLLVSLLALAALHLPACGPSGAQIRAARTATYLGDEAAIFQATVAAERAGYDVQATDPASSTLVTVERWYEADGTFAGSRWDHARRTRRVDRSILLSYRVTLVREGGRVRVEVIPVAHQLVVFQLEVLNVRDATDEEIEVGGKPEPAPEMSL